MLNLPTENGMKKAFRNPSAFDAEKNIKNAPINSSSVVTDSLMKHVFRNSSAFVPQFLFRKDSQKIAWRFYKHFRKIFTSYDFTRHSRIYFDGTGNRTDTSHLFYACYSSDC